MPQSLISGPLFALQLILSPQPRAIVSQGMDLFPVEIKGKVDFGGIGGHIGPIPHDALIKVSLLGL